MLRKEKDKEKTSTFGANIWRRARFAISLGIWRGRRGLVVTVHGNVL